MSVAKQPTAVPISRYGRKFLGTSLPNWSTSAGIAIITVCFAFIAAASTLRVPLWEGMDEFRHLTRARDFAAGRIDFTASELHTVNGTGVEYHPPLYYAMIAPLVHLADGSIDDGSTLFGLPRGVVLAERIARLASMFMGAVSLIATYLLIRTLLRNDRLAVAVAAFTALTPSFVMTSSGVNDDAAAMMWSSLTLLAVCRVVTIPRSSLLSVLSMVILLGLALLTKTTTMALVPVVAIAAIIWIMRQHAVHAIALSLVGMAGLVGTYSLVQAKSPAMGGRVLSVMGGQWLSKLSELLGSLPSLTITDLAGTIDRLNTTYWGFSSFQTLEPLPVAVRGLVAIFAVLAVVGMVVLSIRHSPWAALPKQNRLACLLLGGTLLLTVAGVLLKDLAPSSVYRGSYGHARYVLPVVSLTSLVLVVGIVGAVPSRCRNLVLAFFLAALVGVHATATFSGSSSYTGALASTEDLPSPFRSTSPLASFDKGLDLVGYTLSPGTVLPGDEVDLSLYWKERENRGEEVVVFVHLVAPDGTPLLKADQVPAAYRFPPSVWRAGDVVRDWRRLDIPSTAAPGKYQVQVGIYAVYSPASYLVTQSRLEQPQTGRVTLGSINVRPQPVALDTIARPMQASFGDTIDLIGYDLAPPQSGSDHLRVTLYWRARAPLAADYAASIQLLDPSGRLVSQADGPIGGSYSTTLWEPDKVVAEQRELDVPRPEAGPNYAIAVAAYLPPNGQRLSVTGGTTRYDANLLDIGEVTTD